MHLHLVPPLTPPPEEPDDLTVTVPLAWANDDRLSFRARGLLLVLAAAGPDWREMTFGMLTDSSAGDDLDTILDTLRECVDHGYDVCGAAP